MMDPYPLHALSVCRSFGNFQALAPTDLTIQAGQLTILTGPNGAGKTTLLHCLCGLLAPSGGTVLISGHDLYAEERQAKRDLAFVPDVPRFYTELTAWEHLEFVAFAHDAGRGFAERAETLLRKFGLWDARNLYPHNYSRGMRLKLGLLLALIRPFKTLLLDEPTSALDSESITMLLAYLKTLRAQGAGILLSTHNADLSRNIADRRLEISAGRLEEV